MKNTPNFLLSIIALALSLCSIQTKAELTNYVSAEASANAWDLEYLENTTALGLSGALGLNLYKLVSVELGYNHYGAMNFINGADEGELRFYSITGSALLHIPLTKKLQFIALGGAEKFDYSEKSTAKTYDFKDEQQSYFGFGLLLARDSRSLYRLTLSSHLDGDIIRLGIGGMLDI